ncbi:MAG TPA: hypothetical protein VGC01_12860 [Mucilaginibacter sp.]
MNTQKISVYLNLITYSVSLGIPTLYENLPVIWRRHVVILNA